MNKCNTEYIKRLGIDFSKIDQTIYTKEEINWIVSLYGWGLESEEYDDIVSIEDLIGLPDYIRYEAVFSFPEVLDSFFDNSADNYYNRALGMLEYDENNVLSGLERSFLEQPIRTIEIDGKKNIISNNGIHRFLVLRLLYLHAKSKCTTAEEVEKLKQKFTIPVRKSKMDILKIYCKYLIDIFQPVSIMDGSFNEQYFDSYRGTDMYVIKKMLGKSTSYMDLTKEEFEECSSCVTSLDFEYDQKGRATGRSRIKTFNGVQSVLTDEELIEYTKQIIQNSPKFEQIVTYVSEESDFFIIDLSEENTFLNLLNKYDSFRAFLEMYFSDVFKFRIDNGTFYVETGKKI